jgi:hypothetical protein
MTFAIAGPAASATLERMLAIVVIVLEAAPAVATAGAATVAVVIVTDEGGCVRRASGADAARLQKVRT